MTRLSVIIPTYNYIERLRRCIDSVLSQLPEDCECIVVDDGSEEAFVRELKQFEGLAPNLRIEYLPHGGASAARNAGISLARGEYLSFVDADDEMAPGFFDRAEKYPDGGFDLCIFAIDALHEDTGIVEKWQPGEAAFASANEFADEYIRTRKLLVYSQCNKFYRRRIIVENGIRFDEGHFFGEDRLFNYAFIEKCGKIATSDIPIIVYHMRNENTQSTRYMPDLFNRIMTLHERKMDCFLRLSTGTTPEEQCDFRRYDLCRELENMIERFKRNERELKENIDSLNNFISGGPFEPCGRPDAVIVLGSHNCGYRADAAFEAFEQYEPVYFVTGGNFHKSLPITEAEFMMNRLVEKGVPPERIILEKEARNTMENLILVSRQLEEHLLSSVRPVKTLAIASAWFHFPTVTAIIEKNNLFKGMKVCYLPAYGEHTGQYTWFLDENYKKIILNMVRHRA